MTIIWRILNIEINSGEKERYYAGVVKKFKWLLVVDLRGMYTPSSDIFWWIIPLKRKEKDEDEDSYECVNRPKTAIRHIFEHIIKAREYRKGQAWKKNLFLSYSGIKILNINIQH